MSEPTPSEGDVPSVGATPITQEVGRQPVAQVVQAAWDQFRNPAIDETGLPIGPYKILGKLGEGGMGSVYLAEQEKPIHRRVALKIIKLGMDTKNVVARFETEREALALMNHPNVARVFDAGATGTGRPYFVMEYVQGVPITDYCDTHRLTTHERLSLFVDVCSAIQHAHQKGVIHRDIKPSNVLVAVQDNKPVVKVIDFGVAKATQQRLTERTLFTEQGQMIGTPGYMSPEQAEMTALDIDTRTDVYSLGVLLYELLVGTRPFEQGTLLRAGFAEIQRVIREVDPPKPSTRFSSMGAQATIIAHKRQTQVRTLSRQLRGDLDWIAMKCLEKDRTRRYDSATSLAADVQRFLQNEPVSAGPPDVVYRLRKLIQRNRATVAASLTLLAAMSAGILGTTWQAVKATKQRDRAIEAERLESVARAREKAHKETLERTVYFRNIMLASEALQRGDTRTVSTILRQCSQEQRHWEWHYLDRKRDSAFLTLRGSHHEQLDVAFPNIGTEVVAVNGRRKWTGDGYTLDDVEIKRWSIADGSVLQTSKIELPGTMHTSVNTEGTHLVASRKTGEVFIYDLQSASLQQTIHTDFSKLRAYLSPDASRAAIGGLLRSGASPDESTGPGSVVIRASSDGAAVCDLGIPWPYVPANWRFTSDARRLMVLAGPDVRSLPKSPDRKMVDQVWLGVYDLDKCQLIREFSDFLGSHTRVSSADLSMDGRYLSFSVWPDVGSQRAGIVVFDFATNEPVVRLESFLDAAGAMRFSPDSRWLAKVRMLPGASSSSAKIEITDTHGWETNQLLMGHTSEICDMKFHPVKPILGTASNDGTVKLWSLDRRGLPEQLDCGNACFAVSQDGTVLAGVSREGELTLVDLRDRTVTRRLNIGKGPRVLAFSKDGRRLFVGGAWEGDGLSDEDKAAIKVIDVAGGETDLTYRGLARYIKGIAISPDGAQLVATGGSRRGSYEELKAWGVQIGDVTGTFGDGASFGGGPVFSSDGKHVAVGTTSASAIVYDATDRHVVKRCQGPAFIRYGAVTGLAFVAAGDALLFVENDGTVNLCKLTPGQERTPIAALEGGLSGLACTPDGERCASAGVDKTIRLWDVPTKQLVLEIPSPDYVNQLGFTPDGTTLIARSDSGTTVFLDGG